MGGLYARLGLSRPTVDGFVARWAVEAKERGVRVDHYTYWTECEAWIQAVSARRDVVPEVHGNDPTVG